MKKELHIRITERRINKLRLLAVEKDKTITQIVEELIDTLPEPTWNAPEGATHS
ncbi:hypothetical protein NUACC21_02470 [Scytonema sp. NUACC21]